MLSPTCVNHRWRVVPTGMEKIPVEVVHIDVRAHESMVMTPAELSHAKENVTQRVCVAIFLTGTLSCFQVKKQASINRNGIE